MAMLSAPSVPSLKSARRWLGNAGQRLFRSDALVQADATPFQVISDDGLVQLRYYPPLRDTEIELDNGEVVPVSTRTQRTPLVLVPPLAVNMLIYDLFPRRSLVRYLRARGFELYLVTGGGPGGRKTITAWPPTSRKSCRRCWNGCASTAASAA